MVAETDARGIGAREGRQTEVDPSRPRSRADFRVSLWLKIVIDFYQSCNNKNAEIEEKNRNLKNRNGTSSGGF
jgi:hypothetical protein